MVAAPGAGLMLIPIQFGVELIYTSGTQWSSGGISQLFWGAPVQGTPLGDTPSDNPPATLTGVGIPPNGNVTRYVQANLPSTPYRFLDQPVLQIYPCFGVIPEQRGLVLAPLPF